MNTDKDKDRKLNNENYVAHYTNRKSLEIILKSNQIRFGKVKRVNDLTENLMDWFEGDPATGGQQSRCIIKYSSQEKRIITLLKNRIRVFCATQCKNLSGLSEQGLENKYYAIPNLWAQYGDRQKGTCLILDKRELTKEIKKNYTDFNIHKQVEYRDSFGLDYLGNGYHRGNFSTYLRHFDNLWSTISKDHYLNSRFFSKTKCWEIENEYRWMIFSKIPQPSYFNIKSSLKAIILGGELDLNKKNDLKILRWISENRDNNDQDYPIYQIYCEHNQYHLEEIPIDGLI